MISIAGKYKCPACGAGAFGISSTQWRCESCGQAYACVEGMPKLYIEQQLGEQDRKLRDGFYDGLFGRLYQFMMPFIVMPVRPWAIAWRHWLIYATACVGLLLLAAGLGWAVATGHWPAAILLGAVLTAAGVFLARHPYLLYLLLLAIPAKLSLLRRSFTPEESFAEVHARVLTSLKVRPGRLQVLDVSTGSCNSLYRHGWMSLDADYTAIDLSETMLKQGARMMSRNGVAVELVLGDAMDLPFQSEQFDVVLSYGAVNGLTDSAKAIAEMARVAKSEGTLLFLDEQMYPQATPVERAYFEKVLSAHNVIHRCPAEQLPANLSEVQVRQVYQFYYICTATRVPIVMS